VSESHGLQKNNREVRTLKYKSGGDNPFRVEGATEWLALMCFNQYGIAYQAQLDKTFAWIQADSGNVPRLLAFVFRGIYTDLSSIHP
jgi:hypothetical protein